MDEHHIIFVLVLVTGLGITAQWVAWRWSLPSIVLLALAGLIFGKSGFELVNPEQDFGQMLIPIVKLCVAIILFEGGLTLRLHELKEAASGVRRLIFPAVPLSWLAYAATAHYVGGIEWPLALIFGAIIVVTGPTVIIPLLRQAKLKRRPASYIKWEGIINDPIGALLAVLVFQYFVSSGTNTSTIDVILHMAWALIGAGAVGAFMGYIAGYSFQRRYVPEFLKAPLILGLALVAYLLGDYFEKEAGLVAVTAFGFIIGNFGLPNIDELRRFKEYITIMLVSVVFILLTADIDVASLQYLDWRTAMLLFSIIFIVRPLVIMISTIRSEMELNERILTAWIAPRGIVAAAIASVFAHDLAKTEGVVSQPEILAPLIFCLVFATVICHGFTIRWFAQKLGLASAQRNTLIIVGASPWTIELARTLREIKVSVKIVDVSWHRLQAARLAGIPVYYGQILSEYAEKNLELTDVGFLLAATDNDAYNALICTRFAPELGREHVYQLPMLEADESDPKGMQNTIRGLIAFGENLLYEEMLRRHFQGWVFQKTKITETYNADEFTRDTPPDAVQIMRVAEDGTMEFSSSHKTMKPRVGDTVISFLSADARKTVKEKKPTNETIEPANTPSPATE